VEAREIQSILRNADMGKLEIFLWYVQSNEELVNRFINNMSKRAGDMMREDIEAFPAPIPTQPL